MPTDFDGDTLNVIDLAPFRSEGGDNCDDCDDEDCPDHPNYVETANVRDDSYDNDDEDEDDGCNDYDATDCPSHPRYFDEEDDTEMSSELSGDEYYPNIYESKEPSFLGKISNFFKNLFSR